VDEQISKERFKLIDESQCSDGKLRNWSPDKSNLFVPMRTAIFLSKIWANYGSPATIKYEGFSYCFHDTELDVLIDVYCGASGPAFGGIITELGEHNLPVISEEKKRKLNQSLDDFEVLLANTDLVDCEVEFDTDFGRYKVGVKNGIPFEDEGAN
jgi:hypothetical protein